MTDNERVARTLAHVLTGYKFRPDYPDEVHNQITDEWERPTQGEDGHVSEGVDVKNFGEQIDVWAYLQHEPMHRVGYAPLFTLHISESGDIDRLTLMGVLIDHPEGSRA